jgi:NitT/TauT family transport system substrate-binding protein
VNASSTSGKRPLTVGLVARIFNNMPVWAAQRRALMVEADLSVRVKILYGVGAVTEALRQGRIDIAIGTPESVLSDDADPTDPNGLRIVGGNASALANGLIARRGITSIEDLRGGVIGVSHPSEGTALLVTEMLAGHGLRPGLDFEIVAAGVAEQRWERIKVGTLDAGLQTPPHKYEAEDEGFPNLGDIAEVVPEYQFTTINVRNGWAQTHRSELRAFLAALAEATRWMYADPEGTIALAVDVLETNPDYARRDYEHFSSRRSLHPAVALSKDGMAKVVSVMTQAGTLVADTPAKRAERIDLSYLPQPSLSARRSTT